MRNQGSLLSVISSNYNHAHYIEEALEAIVNQNYSPMEFLIVDDASTDNSVEIIERFVASKPNMRLIKNDRNIGLLPNIQKLMALAGGDYVHWPSSDDRVLPGLYEKAMDLLSRHPEAGICFVETIFIDGEGNKIGEDSFHLSDKPRYFSPEEMVEILRKKMIHISGLSTIYRRSALIEAGGFIPELKSYSDFFPNLVLAFRYGACYIPETLVVCRLHKNQYSANLFKNKKAHCEIINQMLNLLNSPSYNDIRPFFKKSLALAYLFSPVISVLLHHSKFRYYLSTELFFRTYWRTIKKRINPYLPLSLKNVYYHMRNLHSRHLFAVKGSIKK